MHDASGILQTCESAMRSVSIDLDLACIEALERAVAAAFPNRDRLILREVVRWFWDSDVPGPPGSRCSFCRREVAAIEAGSARICRFCLTYYTERAATRIPLPGADMILLEISRAVEALASADIAARLNAALGQRHAIACPQPLSRGSCSNCSAASETVRGSVGELCLPCIRRLAAGAP